MIAGPRRPAPQIKNQESRIAKWLVGLRKPGVRYGRGVAPDAGLALRLLTGEGNIPDRRLRFRLDLRLAFRGAAPGRYDETGTAFHDLLELVVRVGRGRVLLAELQRTLEERLLDALQHLLDAPRQPVHRHERLLARVAPRQHDLRFLDVLWTDLEAQRHPAQLPLVELPAGRLRVAIVEHHADPAGDEAVADRLSLRQHRLLPVAARNRDDDHLIRRNRGRENQPSFIAVRHDDAADHTGGHTPRRAVHVLHRLVASLERDVEDLC